MTNLRDGMKRGQIVVADLSGTAPIIEAVEIGSGAVLTVNISGAQVTTAKIAAEAVTAPKQAVIGTGSPPAFGRSILSGEGTLNAGSTVWIVFGKAFAAAPHFIAMYSDRTIGDIAGSPIGAGSASTVGDVASKKFHWIAIGSGAL